MAYVKSSIPPTAGASYGTPTEERLKTELLKLEAELAYQKGLAEGYRRQLEESRELLEAASKMLLTLREWEEKARRSVGAIKDVAFFYGKNDHETHMYKAMLTAIAQDLENLLKQGSEEPK